MWNWYRSKSEQRSSSLFLPQHYDKAVYDLLSFGKCFHNFSYMYSGLLYLVVTCIGVGTGEPPPPNFLANLDITITFFCLVASSRFLISLAPICFRPHWNGSQILFILDYTFWRSLSCFCLKKIKFCSKHDMASIFRICIPNIYHLGKWNTITANENNTLKLKWMIALLQFN